MEYLYYVGEGAKEEELGPIGRVFLNGHPESSPDLRLYLEREFPLRDYFVHRDARRYMALPLFESHDQICVGVLEFFGCPFTFEAIVEKLAAANLRSVNISHHSCFKESGFPNKNIVEGQQVALDEINVMIELVRKSPQLQVASVWIPCSECAYADNKMSCLELASSSDVDLLELSDKRIHDFIKSRKFLQLHPWKGVIGRTLESENKLCFCQNFCDFSIIEQPLAHYAQVARL
ncbi:protein NLP6-like [Henckelia pumila]|uniref:protein NLP6-like n=1 Tax=Henckelia pumila TaxID=405737 RepID=UPI003C6E29EB